ncbi:MAG: hypothetical protein SGPRY_003564 [Prymnesium sp.]
MTFLVAVNGERVEEGPEELQVTPLPAAMNKMMGLAVEKDDFTLISLPHRVQVFGPRVTKQYHLSGQAGRQPCVKPPIELRCNRERGLKCGLSIFTQVCDEKKGLESDPLQRTAPSFGVPVSNVWSRAKQEQSIKVS